MVPLIAMLAAATITANNWSDTVPDRELATMRGGFLLPNGLDIAIGIDIQTRIDGVLALRTIYTSETLNAGIHVYADGRNSTPPTAAVAVPAGSGTAAPSIEAGRAPSGTTVVPGRWGQPTTVNVVSGGTAIWLNEDGQSVVPVTVNGPPVAAGTGMIALTTDPQGAVVTLTAPGVEVSHLVGQATGAVVSNTANDRVIDTTSTVNVSLAGVPAALLGGTLMLNRIASEAVARR